jgi:hypothetical protein
MVSNGLFAWVETLLARATYPPMEEMVAEYEWLDAVKTECIK